MNAIQLVRQVRAKMERNSANRSELRNLIRYARQGILMRGPVQQNQHNGLKWLVVQVEKPERDFPLLFLLPS